VSFATPSIADDIVWVHGNPLNLPDYTWPAGKTPRAVLRLEAPIRSEWRRRLEERGLRHRFWCPPAGICVDLPEAYAKDTKTLGVLGFVRAGCDYTETMCQRFGPRGQTVPTSALPEHLLDIVCFDRAAARQVVRALEAQGVKVLHSGTTKLRVLFAGSAALRALPGVKLVDAARLSTLLSAAELRNSVAVPAAVPNPWDLAGEGEVIAIADTGLDSGNLAVGMHPDFAGRVRALESLPMNPTWSAFAKPSSDDAADRASGHGTHVAGLALGSGAASQGLHGGLAPASELVFLAIEQKVDVLPAASGRLPSGYYLAGRPVDLRDLFRAGAAHGGTLHNISWGDATQGAYNDDCFETDLYLREAPFDVVVCAAGNDGVDRDGNRRIDSGSLYAPACAKNTIAVGACEGPLIGKGSRATWGQLDPSAQRWRVLADRNDPVSGEADRIAPMSSCGPTRDGRMKPDLCAPGTNLASTRSRSTTYQGWGLADPLPLYMYDGGTSMAAPVVTGGIALMRQAWRREWKKSRRTPTGAALKALALLSCIPVRARGIGQASPWEAGFGRLAVARALPKSFNAVPGWRVTLRDAATQRLETGQHRDIAIRLAVASHLRVVLCWYDPPGERLINDLDLSLLDASGQSIACGAIPGLAGAPQPDHCNPVECLDTTALSAGRYLIRVSGFNVMDGPQRYALAWAIEPTAAG
jgi:subtilisin family serine protease